MIRLAVEADAAAISFLLGELGHPLEPARVVRKLEAVRGSSMDRIWVAELMDVGGHHFMVSPPFSTDALAGLLSFHAIPMLHTPGHLGRITALVVHPDVRGRGVGRGLVAVAEAFARDCGCERLELTSAAHRREAHRFYEKLGYSPHPVRFTKELGPSSARPS